MSRSKPSTVALPNGRYAVAFRLYPPPKVSHNSSAKSSPSFTVATPYAGVAPPIDKRILMPLFWQYLISSRDSKCHVSSEKTFYQTHLLPCWDSSIIAYLVSMVTSMYMSIMLYLQNLPGISPLQSWLLFAKSNAVDLPCPDMHVVCKIDYFFFEIISVGFTINRHTELMQKRDNDDIFVIAVAVIRQALYRECVISQCKADTMNALLSATVNEWDHWALH